MIFFLSCCLLFQFVIIFSLNEAADSNFLSIFSIFLAVVILKKKSTFKRLLQEGCFTVDHVLDDISLERPVARMAERYSHSGVYHNNSVYVFGGSTKGTSNTTFNDMWRFDLSTRTWIRPLVSGEHRLTFLQRNLCVFEL